MFDFCIAANNAIHASTVLTIVLCVSLLIITICVTAWWRWRSIQNSSNGTGDMVAHIQDNPVYLASPQPVVGQEYLGLNSKTRESPPPVKNDYEKLPSDYELV